jgi:GTP pyrophosphokinase
LSKEPPATDVDNLRKEYDAVRGKAERFRQKLAEVLEALLSTNGVSLGVPLESRVKSWESIADKRERLSLELTNIHQLNDLIGLRVILLFSRDVPKVCELLSQTFSVISREDTSQRLAEAEFGYQSLHYMIRLNREWLSNPLFKGFGDLQAEIQVRTLAQHIWAAGSRFLQYKREAGVPAPVRRSMYRVSALLETVDREFERVLGERESYISGLHVDGLPDQQLNVDLLARILDERLPQELKVENEAYSALLEELQHFEIARSKCLTELIGKRLEAAVGLARRSRDGSKSRSLSVADPRLAAVRSLLFNQSKKFVSTCLDHVSFWRFEKGEVRLVYSREQSGKFWADVLNGRENMRTLQAAWAQILDQPVEVRVTVQAAEERVDKGHVGLVRHMLAAEYQGKWREYWGSKHAKQEQ